VITRVLIYGRRRVKMREGDKTLEAEIGMITGIPIILATCGQEDHSLRPAWANSLKDPISKITRARWTGDMAQVVEHLLCKHEALSLNLSPIGRKEGRKWGGKKGGRKGRREGGKGKREERKEGRKEGRETGRKEGRKEERKKERKKKEKKEKEKKESRMQLESKSQGAQQLLDTGRGEEKIPQ
jgi:hypothetical protein